ncbi:hypothetical protein F4775DRAFT_591416 [Biscogniauxia sp. FL1348]|nr:hypothetical protein F4775DRAFT_591416 [Biscogniauxia sp. FL1348]
MDSLTELQDSLPQDGGDSVQTPPELDVLSNNSAHCDATPLMSSSPKPRCVSTASCQSQTSTMPPHSSSHHDNLRAQSQGNVPRETGSQSTPATLTDQPPPDKLLHSLAQSMSRSREKKEKKEKKKKSAKKKKKQQPLLTQVRHREKPAIAVVIIPGEPDLVAGVIEGIYRELVHASTNCSVELRNTEEGPYLHITAPTKKDAYALVETAQMRAHDLMTGEPSQSQSLFVEPPSNIQGGFRIELHLDDVTGEARPCLKLQNDIDPESRQAEDIQEYTEQISRTLVKTLKREGRLHTNLTTRVHLGHYVLRRYPRGTRSFDYKRFETMVKNPRATGKLNTQIGDIELARATLEFIREDGSPFIPMDSQTPSTAHVVPDYIFEACSEDTRFTANLTMMNNSKYSAGPSQAATIHYQMSQARVYTLTGKTPELRIVNVSPGSNLDWKLEAISEDLDNRKFPRVHRYLQTAKISMKGPNNDFDAYPKISLSSRHELATFFKSVAIKSVYRFDWKATGYIVEIAINRRWGGIEGMTNRVEPDVDLNLSIYGESWDEDVQMARDGAAGNLWGEDLQFLFGHEDYGEGGELIDRVQGFLAIIRDICDTLGSVGK